MNRVGASERLQVGEWLVDPSLDEITRAGRTVKLEPRKMQLLVALARRPGQLVTTEELLDTVWPGVVVTSSSLYQSIALLRKHLGDVTDQPTYIATIPRKGYRLVAPVSQAPLAEVAVSPPVAIATATASAAGEAVLQRRRLQRFTAASGARWLALAVVVALGIAFWAVPVEWIGRWLPWRPQSLAVAVLPFTDLSESQTDRPFCDGLAEELLNGLTNVPGLKVAARNSSFTFRDRHADVRKIGRALAVTHVVAGSVRRAGDRLRITAELVEVASARAVWSESYDRPSSDTLAIQADIARSVSKALRIALTPQTTRLVERQVTADVEAYDLYLLGRHHWQQRTPEAIAKARNYFQLALDRDPRFALAYVGLADTYVGAYYYAGIPVREAAAHAQPLIDKALTLDGQLPEAYATQGLLLAELGRPDEAQINLRRAIALNRKFANAYLWLGIALGYAARPIDALSALESAARLDPLNFVVQGRIGGELTNAGRYEQAIVHLRRAMELAPEHPNPVWGLADLERMRGHLDAAVRWYRRALRLEPRRGDLWVQLGHVYLDLGDTMQAGAAFDRAVALVPTDGDSLLGRAWMLAAANDTVGLASYLDTHHLDTRSSPGADLDVAYLEFLAGRPDRTHRLYDAALPLAESTGYPLFSLWEVRMGRAQAVDVASFDAVAGAHAKSEPRLHELSKILDRFEANGVAWNGLHYLRARIQALGGDPAAAIASLDKAYELGWRRSWWMQRDPALASLRREPAFRAIVARIDLDLAAARRRLADQDSRQGVDKPAELTSLRRSAPTARS